MSKNHLKIRSGIFFQGVGANPSDGEDGDVIYRQDLSKILIRLSGGWQNAATESYAAGQVTTHAGLTATHGISGAIVGTTDTQSLSGKSIITDLKFANEAVAKFYEATGSGANHIGIKAPTSVTSDITLTLPDGVGSSGQVLSSDGTGAMGWVDQSGGGGELNYVSNPSAETVITGWNESTDGRMDVSRTTTESELPRNILTATGIKIIGTATAAHAYVYSDTFTIDDCDKNTWLGISFAVKPISGYVVNDFEVKVWDVTASAYIQPRMYQIPNSEWTFETAFLTSANTTYQLRFIGKAGLATSAGIVVSNIVVGPSQLTQEGEGELNYLSNPSAKTVITPGWRADDADYLSVARTTTASDLPREKLTATGIKILATDYNDNGSYVYSDTFVLDDVDVNKVLKIQWDQKIFGTYASGQLRVDITDDGNNLIATPVIADIPAQNGTFATTVVVSSTGNLRLRIISTTNMDAGSGICISNCYCGPGQLIQGPPISDWTAFTPTVTGSVSNPSNITSDIKYRRDGCDLLIQGYITIGTVGSGVVELGLPGGLVTTNHDYRINLGSWNTYDDNFYGQISYHSTGTKNSTVMFLNQSENGDQLIYSDIDNGDDITINARIPIPAWSSGVYLGSGADSSVTPLNWTTEAITWSNVTLGTGGVAAAKVRRLADSIEVMASFDLGTSADVTGTIALTIPGGRVIDTTKLPRVGNTNALGIATAYDSSAALAYDGIVTYTNSTTVGIRGSTGVLDWNASVPFNWNDSDVLAVHFTVPIVGLTTQDYIGKMLIGFGSARVGYPGLVNNDSSNVSGTPIRGVTDGSGGEVGYIGQIITPTPQIAYTDWAITASQWGDILTIPLTAGRWMIYGGITTYNNGAVAAGNVSLGIGHTSGANSPNDNAGMQMQFYNVGTSTYRYSTSVIPTIVNVTAGGTTNYYLKGYCGSAIAHFQYSAYAFAQRIN